MICRQVVVDRQKYEETFFKDLNDAFVGKCFDSERFGTIKSGARLVVGTNGEVGMIVDRINPFEKATRGFYPSFNLYEVPADARIFYDADIKLFSLQFHMTINEKLDRDEENTRIDARVFVVGTKGNPDSYQVNLETRRHNGGENYISETLVPAACPVE